MKYLRNKNGENGKYRVIFGNNKKSRYDEELAETDVVSMNTYNENPKSRE